MTATDKAQVVINEQKDSPYSKISRSLEEINVLIEEMEHTADAFLNTGKAAQQASANTANMMNIAFATGGVISKGEK